MPFGIHCNKQGKRVSHIISARKKSSASFGASWVRVAARRRTNPAIQVEANKEIMARKDATIETPHEHDVLSGRGNFVNYHPGNEFFRALVRKHKVAYVACPKPQKGKFSQRIVDEIKSRNPPGRFLKQDETTKLWYDIGEKKTLDKTRQALREGAPDIQKELGGDAPPLQTFNSSLLEASDERHSPGQATCSVGNASVPTPYISNPSVRVAAMSRLKL